MKYTIYSDGGCSNNQNAELRRAFFSFLIFDLDGNEVEHHTENMPGHPTNNVAEYEGLLNALRAVKKYNPEEVEVFTDSQLVVKQLNGEFKIKNGALKILARQVKDAEADLGCKLTIKWVSRDEIVKRLVH